MEGGLEKKCFKKMSIYRWYSKIIFQDWILKWLSVPPKYTICSIFNSESHKNRVHTVRELVNGVFIEVILKLWKQTSPLSNFRVTVLSAVRSGYSKSGHFIQQPIHRLMQLFESLNWISRLSGCITLNGHGRLNSTQVTHKETKSNLILSLWLYFF